jgi:hypothetical protein
MQIEEASITYVTKRIRNVTCRYEDYEDIW